jgi:hypothetical protein
VDHDYLNFGAETFKDKRVERQKHPVLPCKQKSAIA